MKPFADKDPQTIEHGLLWGVDTRGYRNRVPATYFLRKSFLKNVILINR